MAKLVMGLGLVFILMGLVVLISPDRLVSLADWESRQGLYLAAGTRIIFGLVLLLSASYTRYPKGLRIFGGLVLLAGLSFPLIPTEVWTGIIRWWLVEHLDAYRFGGGLVGILLGSFLVHAALPEKPTA